MKLNTTVGNITIKLNTDRLDRNLKEAQKLLNEQVVVDCDDFVPFQQGDLREKIEYPKGIYGGEIMYNTPYAHYMYEGIVYGPNIPEYDSAGNLIGFWSPKHKHPTGRKLQYHTEGTGDHWFETAKSKFKDEWVKKVKEIAGQN